MTTNQPRNIARRLLRPLSITVGAIIAAACATTPSDVPTGAAQQALGTTVCNEGSRTAPVSPRWSAAYTGLRAASDLLAAEVANNTSDDIEVRIELRGRGLDKREAVRTLFAGPILRGNKHVLSIAPSTFPVQSIGSKSTAILETTITKSSNQGHLVGIKVRSAPLAHTFAAGYGQVTLSDQDAAPVNAIEGTPTSLDDLALRFAPFLRSMATSTGRVWNGTSLADVGTLPVTTADGGIHRIGQVVTFGANDAGKLDQFMTPIPIHVPGGTGPKFCYRLPGEFIDQGLGESVSAADKAASFGTAFVQDQDGKIIWSGVLDIAGCTSQLSNVRTNFGYGMVLLSTMDSNGRRVSIRSASGAPAASAMYFSLDGIKAFSTQVPAWDTHFRAFAALANVLRIDNPGPGQVAAVTVPTGDYRVIMDFCGNNPNAGTACASGDTMFLGPNPDNTHNVDWKFVVVHEFGHLLQEKLSGTPAVPGVPDPYGASEGNASCACAHVVDPTDRKHCMQSREFTGATERESFAHYVSSNAWNIRSGTACKFVYYKRFFETSTGITNVKDAPYPVDCTVQAKWLENKCGTDIAGLAVEWDWMNWKRSVDTAPITENSTMVDIADIYKIACGAGTCTNKQPTPAQLVAAARTKYGLGTNRALRVESDIIRYGANH